MPPAGPPDPHSLRLGQLARSLGVELPLLDGPLCAFRPEADDGPRAPVCIGGDLHAVHPSAPGRRAAAADLSLDRASITLRDLEHEVLQTHARDGLWRIRIEGELLDSAPYFSLTDTDGRLRAWLLLPPARLVIGIAHLWFPAVPAPSASPRAGPPRD